MVEEFRDSVDVLLVFVSLFTPFRYLFAEDTEGRPFLSGHHDLCRPDIPKFAGGLHCHVSVFAL